MIAKFISVPPYFMVPDGKGHWVSDDLLIFYSEKFSIEISVPEGMVNDLASIPRFFRRVFSVNGPHRPAAALHDYLYQTGGLNGYLTRKQCDLIFLEAMLSKKHDYWKACPKHVQDYLTSNGLKDQFINDKTLVDKLTARLIYWGVRLGGSSHF